MKRLYTFVLLLLGLFLASPPTATAVEIADGYYYITNCRSNGYSLQANVSGGLEAVTVDTSGDPVYQAIWQLTTTSDGTTQTIKNIVTGMYIQAQTSQSATYTMGSTGHGFYIASYTTSSGSTVYNIWNATAMNYGLNTSGNSVVAWGDKTDSGNQWTFTAVSLTSSQLSEASALGSATDLSGVYAIKSGAVESVITESSNKLTYIPYSSSSYSTDYDALWILKRKSWDSEYTVQNVLTGNYVQAQNSNNEQYTTGTSVCKLTVLQNTSISSGTYYNFYSTSSKAESFNRQPTDTDGTSTSGSVVSWSSVGNGSVANGEWTLLPVTLTDSEILQLRADNLGYAVPTTGKYYQIYNPARGTYLTVTGVGSSAQLQHLDLKTTDYAKYSQYWTLTADGTGYKITNVYTGKQFTNIAENTSRPYRATDAGSTYYIQTNSTLSLMPLYNIKQSTDATWMPHAEAGGAVVNWTASTDGSITATEWAFKEVTLSSEDIAAAQANYQTAVDAIANTSTYATALQTIFSDNACTELKSGVSDDDFTTAYNALPATLQTAVNKIKGTTDWGSYEKQFRIHDYKPYSDPVKWRDIIGNSDQFSQLEQPTGIYVNEGDIIYVMADQAAPDDATLLVEILGANSATGAQTTLSAGLNVISASQSGNVFISYHCDTHSADTKALADYPDITVHVEGGTLNGYFDAHTTTDGSTAMSDDDWVAMQEAGLFSCTTLNMVSDHLMFSMNAELVKENTPEKICELISVWEFIAVTENNTMGANDTYITNFSARCNNVFGMFSVQSGYMYATTYGTYYNENTLSTVVNNSAMQVAYTNPVSSSSSTTSSAEASGSPGTLWGPAHENGHLRQGLINIVGDTEVSNNVFSNICLWERGYSTTRGNSVTTLLDQYNADNSRFYLDYPEGQDGSGCWDRTRMYWQLYLYYEVAGHHPNFYPELFAELRKDPMVRRSTSTEKQEVTYGYENYLKFAKMCCKVSGDNLTEFFKVYGLFATVNKREVDDYGTYYVTSEKASIDSAITYMSQFKSGAENIIFIEDRIKYTQAEFDGAEEGDMRMDYESSVAIGKCGNVGSFKDYDVNANVKASGYKYTIDDKGYAVIDKNATGAVGYKVYDASGNLVALYNTDTLKISSTILAGIKAGTYVIKAAQADGTCIAMPNPYQTQYELTVYNGTKDDKQTYYITASSDLPTTTASNAVIVAETANVPTAIASAANVVSTTDGTNYTMAADFTLTDKADFYSPVSFTASKVTYERTSPVTYNSVCLPFATTAADFGENSVVYTVGSLASDKTYININAKEDEVAAGTPVLVYCPDEGAWSITKQNVEIVGSPVTTTGSDATLVGSFTNGTIGAGFYKLNSAGTAFGVTTSAGKITAFRSYMSLNDNSGNTSRLAVRIGDETTGINAVGTAEQDNGAWYDLQGRRVLAPAKGIYIHNGRKVIVR